MTTGNRLSVRRMMNYAAHLEVIIDKPVKDVWPHFFNTNKDVWCKVSYIPVAGKSGQVGEIFALPYPGGGELIYEAIVVEPYRRIVLKIDFKNEESVVKLAGYDIVNLQEAAGRTTVAFDQASELPVPKAGSDLAQATQEQDRMLGHIFQTLKHVVENGRPARRGR